MIRRDIFECLREKVQCEYISDMRFSPHNSKAKQLAAKLIVEEYSLQALSDLAGYLYASKERFNDFEQAGKFFTKHCKK